MREPRYTQYSSYIQVRESRYTQYSSYIRARESRYTQYSSYIRVRESRYTQYSSSIRVREALEDLGIRASDLLQANPVIWVEGPSDRKKSLSDPLNATKQRVISECETNGLHAWVTEGREIENYLTPRTVEAAVTEAGLTPDDRFELKATGKFDDSFGRVVGAKAQAWCKYEDNKVPWAHRLVKHIELQDMTPELKKQVTALIAYIRRGSPAAPREKTVHP